MIGQNRQDMCLGTNGKKGSQAEKREERCQGNLQQECLHHSATHQGFSVSAEGT